MQRKGHSIDSQRARIINNRKKIIIKFIINVYS
jgi:hypothetical protein